MENIFTPGPWRIETSGNPSRGGTEQIFSLYGNTPYKYRGEDGRIAILHMKTTYSCDWVFPKDMDGNEIQDASFNNDYLEPEANARLISFAPEMYEMLKKWAYQDNEIKALVERIEKQEEIKICESEPYEIY